MNSIIFKYLNWERIRSIGEMQILTKASYIALIIVPIIAGLWPTVRITLNYYNKMSKEASGILDSAHQNIKKDIVAIQKISSEITSEHISVKLNRIAETLELKGKVLAEQVEYFSKKFAPKTLDIPTMPIVWVFAFFASLLIVLGHACYQAFAPDLVKKYTRFEFIDKTRSASIETGNSSEEHLKHAEDEANKRYDFNSLKGVFAQKLYSGLLYGLGLFCIGVVIFYQVKAIINAATIYEIP